MMCIFFLAAMICVLLATTDADMQETSTKHVFKSEHEENRKLTLAGVGVRVKQIGPIKANVYSAAVYVDKSAILAKLRGVTRQSLGNKRLLELPLFEEAMTTPKIAKSVVLRMARDVGSATMVDALAESVKPRLTQDISSLDSFQEIMISALKGGKAKNNMLFRFDTKGNGKLDVVVDGVKHGEVNSPSLVKAFFGVYLDKKTVSRPLQESASNTITSWL